MDVRDAESTRHAGAIQRRQGSGRARLLVLFFVAQTLLMVLCVAASFHSLWTVQSQVPSVIQEIQGMKVPSIYLQVHGKPEANTSLQFNIEWSREIELQNKSKIKFPCTGPYLVYVALKPQVGSDTSLILRGRDNPLYFPVTGKSNQSIHYFKKGDAITVDLTTTDTNLRLDELSLGFQYLVGNVRQCIEDEV